MEIAEYVRQNAVQKDDLFGDSGQLKIKGLNESLGLAFGD